MRTGRFPSIAAYNRAVLNLRSTGQTATLRSLRPRVQGMGTPRIQSGGFALTYEVRGADHRRYALRCFQSSQADRPFRYRSFAGFARSLPPHDRRRFVSFEYLFNGLAAGESRVPVVLMEWAPGDELGVFLEQHHADATRLAALRAGLADLAAFLENHDFAHGDLQVGNLFVCDQGRLVMIDYDGAWLPALNKLDQHEWGHVNFQHPLREERRAGPGMDRFSLITMDVALHALVEDASLWERYATGENVLFTQADFVEPAGSPLLRELAALPRVATAAHLFAEVCTGAYEEVPTLGSFRAACRTGKASWLQRAAADVTLPGATHSAPQQPSVRPPDAVALATRRRYRGQYPVVAATNVDTIAELVGRKIEVVGRVYGVKSGTTRNGDPYRFVNFSDWRGRAFKVNVWSDALAEFGGWPDESWEARWVSVTGLVDEPFESEEHGYTHFSITANRRTQIRTIDRDEAGVRLASSGAVDPGAVDRGAG